MGTFLQGRGKTYQDRNQWGRRLTCVGTGKGWKGEGTYYLLSKNCAGITKILSFNSGNNCIILTFQFTLLVNNRKEGGSTKSLTLKPLFFSLQHTKGKGLHPTTLLCTNIIFDIKTIEVFLVPSLSPTSPL